MKITHLSLPAADPAAAALFFEVTLGLAGMQDRGLPCVRIGYTSVRFFEAPAMEGVHHLAITIPTGEFTEAKHWLGERAPLLRHEGRDEFETAPSWNARSIYFDGPEGSILELIERRDLDNARVGLFSNDHLLGVSEVGIAVPDVLSVAADLDTRAGIAAYGTGSFDDFAPVGDTDGLLILVAPGRSWFPTGDRVSAASPIGIRALGEYDADVELGFGARVQITSFPPASDDPPAKR